MLPLLSRAFLLVPLLWSLTATTNVIAQSSATGSSRPNPAQVPLGPSKPATLSSKSFDYWLSGHPEDSKPDKIRGGMFLSGGGGQVSDAWRWFIECAGGGNIVVLNALGTDFYQDFVFETLGNVDSVETIRFNEASAANDPKVLDIISRADGIFMSGGKQTRYIAWWKDSPIEAAINAHVMAGKPLGGTSAGLAIIGHYYYGSMEGSVRTETALGDPFDKRVDIGKDFIAAPVLVDVLPDSHFSNRQRLGRLLAFLGRTIVDENPKRLVGLGIDEGTALCVENDGTAKLFTEKDGSAWLVETTQPPTIVEPGKPLEFRHVKVTQISSVSRLNLVQRSVTNPQSVRFVSAVEGRLVVDP
ncbi:MAG: cyanophycinase [Pirellulaceae bacterium]|nr:cyanophycinase [Pirellulaceae bacterium]